MKTKSFTPNFYLAHKDQLIRIDSRTIIGRVQGNVILEDDELLSSTHCEIIPRILEVFIKDLNSTNGVYVNNQKIAPSNEVKVNVGDILKIGSRDYKLLDDEKEAKKILPNQDKRKHPRPKNLSDFKNLLTFYSAHNLFRGIYCVVLLLALASFILNINIEVPVPESLKFIATLYSNQIVFYGIKVLFFAWIISLIHSFLMVLYFNRNPIRQIAGLIAYILVLIVAIDFRHGPLKGVKSYIVERSAIEQLQLKGSAIVNLKRLVTLKDNLTESFKFTLKKLNEKEKRLLEEDYKKLIATVDAKIGKLKTK